MGALELAGLEVEFAEKDLPGVNDRYPLLLLAGPEYIFDRAKRSAYISIRKTQDCAYKDR